jgi:hypothetical protein
VPEFVVFEESGHFCARRGDGEVRSNRGRFSSTLDGRGSPMIRHWNLFALLLIAGCSPSPSPSVIRLVDVFDETMVEGGTAPPRMPVRTEWRFDETGSAFTAVEGVEGLSVGEGVLRGRATTDRPVLHVERTTDIDGRDQLHAVEVRIRVSAGANLKAEVSGAEKIDPKRPLQDLPPFDWAMTTPLIAGEEMRTYTLKYPRPMRASQIRRLYLRPTDAAGATFEIESVRIIFRKEHLASIPSGIGFQGMSEIYRIHRLPRPDDRASAASLSAGAPARSES